MAKVVSNKSIPKRKPRKVNKHKQLLNDHRHRYEELLKSQGGHCALCNRQPTYNRRLDIDHDHDRMVIRGLLCFRCNRALPHWMTRDWLLRAADYVNREV